MLLSDEQLAEFSVLRAKQSLVEDLYQSRTLRGTFLKLVNDVVNVVNPDIYFPGIFDLPLLINDINTMLKQRFHPVVRNSKERPVERINRSAVRSLNKWRISYDRSDLDLADSIQKRIYDISFTFAGCNYSAINLELYNHQASLLQLVQFSAYNSHPLPQKIFPSRMPEYFRTMSFVFQELEDHFKQHNSVKLAQTTQRVEFCKKFLHAKIEEEFPGLLHPGPIKLDMQLRSNNNVQFMLIKNYCSRLEFIEPIDYVESNLDEIARSLTCILTRVRRGWKIDNDIFQE